jgi:hypothetical protein
MIENIFIGLFIFGFGAQVGRILTLRNQARKTVEGIEALINAKWIAPQVLAVRLHRDQEAIEVPHYEPSLTLRCRMIHYGVKAR